jgi:hypothetical protein
MPRNRAGINIFLPDNNSASNLIGRNSIPAA